MTVLRFKGASIRENQSNFTGKKNKWLWSSDVDEIKSF